MLTENAAAEVAGNKNRVARLPWLRRSGPREVRVPNAVMLMTSGPFQELVSPPAMATSNSVCERKQAFVELLGERENHKCGAVPS